MFQQIRKMFLTEQAHQAKPQGTPATPHTTGDEGKQKGRGDQLSQSWTHFSSTQIITFKLCFLL